MKFDGVSIDARAARAGGSARDAHLLPLPARHAGRPAAGPCRLYVRQGDWKLIRFFCDNDDQTDRFELYNLKDDLGESHNLAAAHAGQGEGTQRADRRLPARHEGRRPQAQPGVAEGLTRCRYEFAPAVAAESQCGRSGN